MLALPVPFPWSNGLGDNVLAIPEEVVLLLSHLDGRAAILGDQYAVALVDAHGHALAVLVQTAGPNRQHLGLVELLDARFGEEEAAGRLGLGLDALHEHAVEERDERLDGAERGGLEGRNSVSKFQLIDGKLCLLLGPASR